MAGKVLSGTGTILPGSSEAWKKAAMYCRLASFCKMYSSAGRSQSSVPFLKTGIKICISVALHSCARNELNFENDRAMSSIIDGGSLCRAV